MNKKFQNPNIDIVIGKIRPTVIIIGIIIVMLLLGGFMYFCNSIAIDSQSGKDTNSSLVTKKEKSESTLLHNIIESLSISK